MKLGRPSVRWVLLGVAAASILMPLLALISLRSFDAALVRQTERELSAQGALIAAVYQQLKSELEGRPAGNPRPASARNDSYVPFTPQLADLTALAGPVPDPLPTRQTPLSPSARRVYSRLSQTLERAQLFNLSGVRVLDLEGCAVASTRALDQCYGALPEVQAALAGNRRSVLRARISDEPPPAFTSWSRRGDLRVFLAVPVYDDSRVVGAVLLSRTAESGLEWLFKQRRGIFYGGSFVLFSVVLVSFGFSRWITRPLSQMSERLASDSAEDLKLRSIRAPQEIHALGVALDERSAELVEKKRYIEEFAANVSHELKTPLTSIRGAVELLQEQGATMDDAQRTRFLANIDAAAARTDRLVSRLLQLARLETGRQVEDETVGIDAWLGHLRERYGDQLVVHRATALDAQFSATALEAVVQNLVDNALRYRREQPVTLDARLEGPHLHLSVEDDGPGIAADNKKRLFERFFTTERDRGGTGLGLAIVLATAQSHGGRVEVNSSDAGTRVDVWMQLTTPSAQT